VKNHPISITEQRNPKTRDLDRVSTLQMVQMMNSEDHLVAPAVAKTLPVIAAAIDEISKRMSEGGRLFYIGAGTSGRLGVLDASECPPTFNADLDQVVGIIAGGDIAIRHAVEEIEDRPEQGAADLARQNLKSLDSVVGLASSGRTPYVLGAVKYARQLGAYTVAINCVPDSPLSKEVHLSIEPITGPETLTGSTRLKAGTAQKMVLNMISTGVMVKLGKVYSNLMVDARATNSKLRARSFRIIQEACGVGDEQAAEALQACDGEVKTAIVMVLNHTTPENARSLLIQAGGNIHTAVHNQSDL
jgi:N-acetylmuramic acid 6-phosphate etherase